MQATSKTSSCLIAGREMSRPDGGPGFTLGLAASPAGDDTAAMDELLGWRPDIVIAIASEGNEEDLDDLAGVLGEVVLETIDTDAWPTPNAVDLLTERREILCHVLSSISDRADRRILMLSETGKDDVAILAAELLVIAGHGAEDACKFAAKLARVDMALAETYLGNMPEASCGALGLPYEGGWLVTRPSTREPGKEELHAILRADGYHEFRGTTAFDVAALTGGEECQGVPQEAPMVSLQALAAAGTFSLRSMRPASLLADYVRGFAKGQLDNTSGRPVTYLGMGYDCYITGRISENDFRALPQS